MGPGTHNYSLFIKIFARKYLKVSTSIWLIISCWIISKHFKMYITINDINGEKRIDLSYSIRNFDSGKEIAVIRMLSDNVKYEILKLRAVMDPISDTKKMIPSRTYAGRELLSMLEGMVELNEFLVDDQVIKKNKLKGITEITLNLDELDNSDNLEDGHPSNSLLTYHVASDGDRTPNPTI